MDDKRLPPGNKRINGAQLRQLGAGVRAELPLLLGVIPFGMIYGVLAIEAGLSAGAAQAMSSIVFAGSAQFIAAELIGVQTPGLVVVLTIFVVNLRHMLYSASVAPFLKPFSQRWKFLLAYLLTDEAYAVTITHLTETPDDPQRNWYFLGAGLTLWSGWQLSTAAGISLGVIIPATWPLDFALALTFIALLVPAIKDRPSAAAALVGGVTALLAYQLPYSLGLMAAAAAGILAGSLLERRS